MTTIVTPEQFGAKKLYDTTYTGKDADSTAAIQAALDSPYPVVANGCYYVPGTLNVTQPKLFQLLGTPDLVNPITGKQVIGCLYSGTEPNDMFHVFSEGFQLQGGLLDFRNCKYSGQGTPRSAIKYHYFYNLIQSGRIDTTIIGSRPQVELYNSGHIGLSIDCSRTLTHDPKGRPAGFSEMHYMDVRLKGLWLNTLIHTSTEEPFQNYSDISLNHPSASGQAILSIPEESGYSATIFNYIVPSNTRRYFTLRWGKNILSFRVYYQSGRNWIDLINEAIVDKGFSSRDFVATSAGPNQSFKISSPHQFHLKVFRPCLATIANIEFHSIGCKQALYLDTMDNATIKGTIQTHPNLVKSPTDPSINEFDMPGATILGNNNTFNLHTVDLNKGSIPGVRQANKVAWINYGEKNKPIGMSLESLYARQAFSKTDLEDDFDTYRHSNWGLQSSQRSFISYLDNALFFAHERFEITYTGAEIRNINSIFQNGPSTAIITYPSDFDELNGIVDISIKPLGKLELLSVYLKLASTNCPREISVTISGSSGVKTITESLIGGFKQNLEFQSYNQNNNQEILIRMVGVKNKTKPVTIQQIAGKNKVSTTDTTPVLTKAGGTVYGPLYFNELYVKAEDGTYKRIQP